MARAEDIGVNRFVADQPQVLDDESWLPRLNIGRRDLGTGMDDGEVDDLSGRVDLVALRSYWGAVGGRTRAVVEGLRPDDLDPVITPEQAHRVAVDERAAGDKAAWLAAIWAGKSRGWFLCQLALAHNYGHLFEARVVKGLWGMRSR